MKSSLSVMAGLVPAIHVFAGRSEIVDAGQPGHDDGEIDEQEVATTSGR